MPVKPEGEVLRRAEWEVRNATRNEAKRLIRAWHYAKGCSDSGAYCHPV